MDAKPITVSKVEVTGAGCLELASLVVEDNKMVGKPVFHHGHGLCSAFVVRTYDKSGRTLRMSLLRVSRTGDVSVVDRSNPMSAED